MSKYKLLALLLGLNVVIFALLILPRYFYLRTIMGPTIVDVSERLTSPDKSKTAILMRKTFYPLPLFELHFVVGIVSGGDDFVNSREYTELEVNNVIGSGDLEPNLAFNWDEDIKWSSDSSLLLLTYNVPDGNEPVKKAYDFLQERRITDRGEIDSLWLERNQILDSNGVTSNQGLQADPQMIADEI